MVKTEIIKRINNNGRCYIEGQEIAVHMNPDSMDVTEGKIIGIYQDYFTIKTSEGNTCDIFTQNVSYIELLSSYRINRFLCGRNIIAVIIEKQMSEHNSLYEEDVFCKQFGFLPEKNCERFFCKNKNFQNMYYRKIRNSFDLGEFLEGGDNRGFWDNSTTGEGNIMMKALCLMDRYKEDLKLQEETES